MTAVNPPPIHVPDLPDKRLHGFLIQLKNAFYLLWNLVGQGTGIIPIAAGGTGAETASAARTNLGLGTIATQNANAVAITGGSITGGTVDGLTNFGTDTTITPALTVGAQTINKPAGSVNFAAAATSLVVTNSLVTANSLVFVTIATNDATARDVWKVNASGSFTIYMDPAPTAETRVDFLVVN